MKRVIILMVIIAFVLSFTNMTVQAQHSFTVDTQVTILENYASLGTRTMWSEGFHGSGNNHFIPAVFVDATTPTRNDETEGSIKIRERGEFVFNGTTMGFQNDGSWAEYDLEVPITGTYKVTFNYATGDGVDNEKILLYGIEVGSSKSTIELTGTGAYGNDLNDYYIAVIDKEIKLTAGTHTIKMTRIANGYINMDVIGFAYVPEANVTYSRSSDFATVQATTAAWAEAEEPIRRSEDGIQERERGGHVSQMLTNSYHIDADAGGSWSEWDLDVPVTGTYKVILSYATDRAPVFYYTQGANELTEAQAIRPLTYKLSFGDKGVIVDLEGTGGWGTHGRHQIIDAVVEKEFFLQKGTQTLRVDRLKDQINMDWIGIKLVREQAATSPSAPSPSTSDNLMLISLLAVMLLSGAFLTWRKLSSVR